jgi:DTW domain-containing protein YfiP
MQSLPALPINCRVILHAREIQKASSTGRLLKHLNICQGNIWQRTQHTTRQILTDQSKQYFVLHPAGETLNERHIQPHSEFILLDGTWQQCHKMLKQDPFLAALPQVKIPTLQPSQLYLRRNQQVDGLSTLETLISLLECLHHPELSAQLTLLFNEFQRRHSVARNQGYYNLCTPL